jgi:hypothetical protein
MSRIHVAGRECKRQRGLRGASVQKVTLVTIEE